MKEDYKQGASWERAKALREKHPNVGIVMVATSDNILEWALQQDWVDVVIPYHLVRTGTDVAEYFGYKNCVNVIQWCYSSGGASKKKLSVKNDTLIVYAKDVKKQTFNFMKEKSYNRDYKPYRFKGVEEFQDEYGLWYTMVGMKQVWSDIPMVGRTSGERNGYQTQKPLKLMDRIIELYTNEDDTVADFFCGSGSFIESANKLNRKYIGCDINPRAIEITKNRLE